LVRDRDDVRARMAVVLAEGRVDDSPFGPRLGVRWWRFGTGVLLGLGCAVKWSGVYWLAAFAILTLVFDATARRAAGVRRPRVGSRPWTWPMGLRPMLYYYASGDKVTGCGTGDCISAVMLIGTPALWWPAIPVLVWSIWRAVTRVDWRYGAVLVGYGAGVVP